MLIQIILSILSIAAIGFIFRKIFPSKEKIQNTDIYALNDMMSKFWLVLFFAVTPVLIYLFYNIFRLIQSYALETVQHKVFDILVLDTIPFALPIGFFALCIGSLIFFNISFSKKFISERLEGLEEGKVKEYYRAIMGQLGFGSFDQKKGEIFILIIGIIFLAPTLLSIDNYIKIDEMGIRENPWSSLGKENFYSFTNIKEIYSIKGTVLNTNTYKQYKPPYYLIKFDKGDDFVIENNNYKPLKRTVIEIMNYISEKTGKSIECKILVKDYVDCSQEAEIMKKYPLEIEN
ncbi:hypothetical protein KKB43_02505 [Patescibacteria group bacterium]|nr:hypothetical protein [Patescibacteria group bacterium]MBU4579863.1 hypothetical protein [Patescibacteria group bacterium]